MTPRENSDPILSTNEASAYLSCRPQTLNAARCTRTGAFATVPFLRLGGGRRIGYLRSDLDKWIVANRVAIAEA